MDTANPTPSITPAQLAELLGRDDAPLLLDVRRKAAFESSDAMLAGARYCAPEGVAALAASQPPRTVVTYCVYGHGVGAQAAAKLRAAGWDARWLEGGLEGGEDGVDAPQDIARWRATPLPRVRRNNAPGPSE